MDGGGDYFAKVGLSENCVDDVSLVNRQENVDFKTNGLVLDLLSKLPSIRTFEIVMVLAPKLSADSAPDSYVSDALFRKRVKRLEDFVKKLKKISVIRNE